MEDIVSLIFFVIYIAVLIGVLAGIWKSFEKAGEKGWACIVPFYNVYVMCRMAGRPGWWFLLLLIPLVGLIMFLIVSIDIARNFGKGAGFGVGLALLGFIFWPILGFGDARWQGVQQGVA